MSREFTYRGVTLADTGPQLACGDTRLIGQVNNVPSPAAGRYFFFNYSGASGWRHAAEQVWRMMQQEPQP